MCRGRGSLMDVGFRPAVTDYSLDGSFADAGDFLAALAYSRDLDLDSKFTLGHLHVIDLFQISDLKTLN